MIAIAVLSTGLSVSLAWANVGPPPTLEQISQQAQAACVAAPANADAIAQASLVLAGTTPEAAAAIARASIQCLIDAGVEGPAFVQEVAEITAALFALLPEEAQDPLAQVIADATPDTSDDAQVIAEAAAGIETAGPLIPFGNRRARPLSRVPSFVQLPTAASPN